MWATIPLIIWLAVIAWHVWDDYKTIELEGEDIDHQDEWIGRLLNAAVVLLFSTYWFRGDMDQVTRLVPVMVFSFWVLFNIGLNKARGKRWNYLGSNFWDRQLKKLGNSQAYFLLLSLLFFSLWFYFRISEKLEALYGLY